MVEHHRIIDRRLAHRRSVSEVFVCDRVRLAADRYVVAVQLPRAHALWSDGHRHRHDTLMAAEAVRQAAIVVAHDRFDIPSGHVMVARSFDMTVDDPTAFRDDHRNPLEGVLLLRVTPVHDIDGAPTGMSFRSTLLVGERAAMTMSGALVFAAETDFALARAMTRAGLGQHPPAEASARPGEPVPPELLGRGAARNVVIRAAPGEYDRVSVIVDMADAAFFDHPLDHVPGQLLTEAVRQAATLAGGRLGLRGAQVPMVVRSAAAFDGFAELDLPTELELDTVAATASGGLDVTARVVQLGRGIGTVTMHLVFRPESADDPIGEGA